MERTKLGVSVGIVGAGLYFLGACSFIPACLLAAYVLLCENNEWLKRTAVKMIAIVISFALLGIGVSMIREIFGVLDIIINWIPFVNVDISVPLNLDSFLNYIITFFEYLVLIVCGFKALSLGNVKIGFVDKLLSKHF